MFKELTEGCKPTRGTKYSACVDLYASDDVTIGAGETKLIGLGVAIDFERLKSISDRDLENNAGLPIDEINSGGDRDADIVYYDAFRESHYLQLMLRSSLSKELIIANGVGVVDLDYKDEIKIRLHNPQKIELSKTENDNDFWVKNKKDDYVVKKGDCIAQTTLVEHKAYLLGIESDVERDGGFGSTDERKD